MDTQLSDPEKILQSDKDIETVPTNRAVAFPDDAVRHDEKIRPTGVELRREKTQEEIRLAAAGYDHLAKDQQGAEDTKFGDVDITEHSLPIHEVESLLSTSFNWTDPAQSRGLTTADAEERLKRDGPNALTPPKKKSAFQKVGVNMCTVDLTL
jgi:sodium/potassium-transporting ATPase subunit alpha